MNHMENDNTFTIEEPSELPYNLLILPLGTKPLFPGMFAPLYITGENDITIVNQAMIKGGIFGAILEKPHKENESFVNAADRFYPVGTSCKILKTLKMPDGGLNIFVSTLSRFRVESFFSTTSYTAARVTYLEDKVDDNDQLKAWVRNLNNEFTKINAKTPMFTDENRLNMVNIENPGASPTMSPRFCRSKARSFRRSSRLWMSERGSRRSSSTSPRRGA